MIPEIETKLIDGCYSKVADEFHKTRRYTWSWVNEFVSNIPNEERIIDIGCGTGRNMMIEIPGKTHIYHGIDMCEKFVEICKRQHLNVIKGSIVDIPHEDNSFDYILCIAMFHHLSTVERRMKALYEMKRILNPGGKILLSVWSIHQPKKTKRQFKHYGDTNVPWKSLEGIVYDRYYYIFMVEELKHLITKCGMTCEKHFWDCGNEVFVIST